MAITILSNPDEHTPAYNEQYYVASGTNTAQTNFKYVCVVTVDGNQTTQKISKRPDNSFLYFNPQRVVESYVKNDYNFDIDEPTPSTNQIKKVTVEINEEYGSPVSGFTGSSGSYFVWNASYSANNYADYTYAVGTSSTLLEVLAANTIHYDQRYLMYTWHRGFSSRTLYKLWVDCYDVNNNQIQLTDILNSYYDTAISDNYYLTTVNCSPYGLDLIETNNPSLIVSKYDPLLDIVPATTAYYDIWWVTGAGLVSSTVRRVYIDDYCSKYTRYTLHFLNTLGGYTPFVFNLASNKSSTIERKEYRNDPFELVSNDLIYYKGKGDRQNYNTVITNKITLNSDWVTDLTYATLKDLFTSPSIKLEDENGVLYAVTCTVKDYKELKRVTDKLFNVTIDVEFDYQDIRQRG